MSARLREHLRDLTLAQASLQELLWSGFDPRDPECLEILRLRLWRLRCALEKADVEAVLLSGLVEAESADIIPLRRAA